MGDKSPARDRKMSVVDYSDPTIAGSWAKQFSRDLLRREHKGPGDTIEAAAERLRRTKKLDPNILLQGWNRPPRDMKISRWLPLFLVWWEEVGSRIEGAYESKRQEAEGHEVHPALLRLADTVAGRVVDETKTKPRKRKC